MCKQCHSYLSDADVLLQLNSSLDSKNRNDEFEQWNTTSVSHVLIALSGHNGPVCKEVAAKLLQRFLDWYEKNKPDRYYPVCGIEKMYARKCFKNVLLMVKDNPDLSDKELLKMFDEEMVNTEKQPIGSDKKISKKIGSFKGISRYDFSDISLKSNRGLFAAGGIIAVFAFGYYLW